MGLGLGLYFGNRYLLAVYGWNVWLSGTLGLVIYLAIAGIVDIRPLLVRKK
jgi:hypothetical protein